MELLAKHGYRQVGFHATFAGLAELPREASGRRRRAETAARSERRASAVKKRRNQQGKCADEHERHSPPRVPMEADP